MDGKSGGSKGRVNVINRGRGIGRKMIVGRKPSTDSSDDEDEDSAAEDVVSQHRLSGLMGPWFGHMLHSYA